MSGKARAVVMMMAVALSVSLMALPASAETTGVGAFRGVAEVGKWFATPCDKDGSGDPDGKGLYLPGTQTVPGTTKGDDIRREEGVWALTVPDGVISAGVNQAGPAVGSFRFAACGYLSATVDPDRSQGDTPGAIGASCGTSKGHHGQGHVVFANGEMLKLFDVGWKASVGGTLPVIGKYQEYAEDDANPNSAAKKDKFGTVLAQVQAQGGAGCLGLNQPGELNNANGAQRFNVVGVAEFINGTPKAPKKERGELPDPGGEKHCKQQGPNLPENPGEKKPKPKPDPTPCNERQGGDKRMS